MGSFEGFSNPELAERRKDAKLEETLAVNTRRAIDAEIIRRDTQPPTGEGTTHPALHDNAVCSISYGITRKFDKADSDLKLKEIIPGPIFDRLVRYKPEINTAELRFLESNEPEIYAKVVQHITSKPASPSVTVDFK